MRTLSQTLLRLRAERDVVRTDRNIPFFEGDENPNLKKLNDILVTYAVFNWDIGACACCS